MRSLLLAVLVLSVLGVALWLAFRIDGDSSRGSEGSIVTSETARAHHASSGPEAQPLSGDSAIAARSELPGAAAPEISADVPGASAPRTCAVFGRVIDEEGSAVVGAEIVMYGVDGPWAEGVEVPTIERRGVKLQAFRTTTTDTGGFRFEVPVPTADWVSLHVEAPAYYGITGSNFGPAGGRNQPRLTPGDNDLGDLAVAITGAVRGRVTSADGSAVTNARIYVDGRFPGGYGVSASADKEGSYELGHVPPGTWSLAVEAKGWLIGKVPAVEVKSRAATQGIDFVLERGPTISGLVIDEAGTPIPNVRVEGWPSSSGRGAGARTGEDGTFTMPLPQNEPYFLRVEDQDEFEPWGGGRSPEFIYEPGRTDVRIVLRRVAQLTFHVLDSANDTPVEHFGLGLERIPEDGSSWNRFSSGFEVAEHPGGDVVLHAQPGKQAVGVVARGYAPLEAPVAHDELDVPIQTLRLLPGAAIVGRVDLAGEPLARANLRLERDRVKIDPSMPDSEDEWFDENMGFDLGDLAGRVQILTAKDDGTFRLEDLAAGTYRLTISGGKAARRVIRGLHLAIGETRDLEAITMDPGSTIRGRVVLGPGLSPIGLELRLGDSFDREAKVSTLEGGFSFEGVEAGEQVVTLESSPPLVIREEVQTVMVRAGETHLIVFDLTAHAPGNVEVRVLRNGHPAAGVRTRWHVLRDGRRAEGDDLGVTDSAGTVRGTCPGGREVRFEVLGDSGLMLGQSAVPVVLPSGGEHVERLEIQTGVLVVVLPPALAIPEAGSVQVTLKPKGDKKDRWQIIQCHTPSAPFRMPGSTLWEAHRLELGEIAVGEYEAVVSVYRMFHDERLGGKHLTSIEMHPRLNASIEVEVGKTTTIEVP